MYQRILSFLLCLCLLPALAACAAPAQAENNAQLPQEPQLPTRTEHKTPEKEDLPSVPKKEPTDTESESKPLSPDKGDQEESQNTPPVQEDKPSTEQITRTSLDSTKPMVALTFDDGPHATYTDHLLDILEENGVVATFFEVGRNLSNDPDAVRRAEAMGCEIGSHSYRHADLGKMSEADIAADLAKADQCFVDVLGHAPTILRPPYGSLNNAVKYTTGRSIVTWSIDTEDWLSRNVEKILAAVQNAGDLNGQVILMHSSYDTSVEAARQLIPWLIEQGYQLVTITELITLHYGDQVLPNGTYGYSYFKLGKDVILPPGVTQPEKPAQPETPPETTQPADPPVQPETPAQPEVPVSPETPGDSSGGSTTAPDTPAQPDKSGEGETPPEGGAGQPGSPGAAAADNPPKIA